MRWWPWRRIRVCRKVNVVCKGGPEAPTFEGVWWDERGGYLVLKEAQLIKGQHQRVILDGEILVPRETIAFIQVVG